MLGLALKDVFKNLDISDSAGAAAMTTLHALSMGLGEAQARVELPMEKMSVFLFRLNY